MQELRQGFETAYIDGSVVSNSVYRPQFVSNNHKVGKKVLSSVEDELLVCDGFQISVAFITMSGITPLLQTLRELEKRNIKGGILTTNYLNFSEPKALKKLNELSNITLKMYDVEAADEGFHTKGYGIQSMHCRLMNSMRTIMSDIRLSSIRERLQNRKKLLRLRNTNCSQTACRLDLLQT